jgi:hypothetical protein
LFGWDIGHELLWTEIQVKSWKLFPLSFYSDTDFN